MIKFLLPLVTALFLNFHITVTNGHVLSEALTSASQVLLAIDFTFVATNYHWFRDALRTPALTLPLPTFTTNHTVPHTSFI